MQIAADGTVDGLILLEAATVAGYPYGGCNLPPGPGLCPIGGEYYDCIGVHFEG